MHRHQKEMAILQEKQRREIELLKSQRKYSQPLMPSQKTRISSTNITVHQQQQS